MPKYYPPYQTCHRRFQEWIKEGILLKILKETAKELGDEHFLSLAESFMDATFSPAKKGGKKLVKLREEKA